MQRTVKLTHFLHEVSRIGGHHSASAWDPQASSELKEIHFEEKLKSIRGIVSGVMGCILNICKKFAECV